MMRSAFVLGVITLVSGSLDFNYHDKTQLEGFLKNFTQEHKALTTLFSIGKSVRGVDLWVVKVTAVKEPALGVPNVKLIGNIHGNEAVGREMLLHFLEYLVTRYKDDSLIEWLLNHTKLYILPSMNPDGFDISLEDQCDNFLGRENANGQNLNRNFPDYFMPNPVEPQLETLAVTKWMDEVPFILSASLHGGALVANYPFENAPENESRPSGHPSLTADDDVFRKLATVYANKHKTMHRGLSCGKDSFPGGITNGAAWYMIKGGMQDYNYAFKGCMELTLEISCCKYPLAMHLPEHWEENKEALLHFILEAHHGVTGQVTDADTGMPIVNATCRIVGRNMSFQTSRNGEFWRLLLKGDYTIKVSHDNYEALKKSFVVLNSDNPHGLTRLNLKMYPKSKTSTSKPTSTTESSAESSTAQSIAHVPFEPNATMVSLSTEVDQPRTLPVSSSTCALSASVIFTLLTLAL